MHTSKQAPPPLNVHTGSVVLVGIGLWGVALVVLTVLGDRVEQMWTWTCLAAIGLGLLGLWIMKLQGQFPRRDRD